MESDKHPNCLRVLLENIAVQNAVTSEMDGRKGMGDNVATIHNISQAVNTLIYLSVIVENRTGLVRGISPMVFETFKRLT